MMTKTHAKIFTAAAGVWWVAFALTPGPLRFLAAAGFTALAVMAWRNR